MRFSQSDSNVDDDFKNTFLDNLDGIRWSDSIIQGKRLISEALYTLILPFKIPTSRVPEFSTRIVKLLYFELNSFVFASLKSSTSRIVNVIGSLVFTAMSTVEKVTAPAKTTNPINSIWAITGEIPLSFLIFLNWAIDIN